MKQIVWLGNTHEVVRGYADSVKRQLGYNLDKVQRGLDPYDWRPMSTIGPGVKEIRIHDYNEYRILYVAKFEECIYVLHSFVKKTQSIGRKDILLARQRYLDMIGMRRIKK